VREQRTPPPPGRGRGGGGGANEASSSILSQAALSYARRGWPVLPIRAGSKEPATAHGVKDATTDEATICRWWATWPRANLGVATGSVSGLVVLDVDPRNGGDESLHDLEARYGPLPDTVTALTGGGGQHRYFSLPEGVTVRSRVLAPGPELKGDGAYVVAPPSVHPSGQLYRWELTRGPGDVPLASLPAWLLELAQDGRSPDRYDAFDGHPIPEGHRHTHLVSLAGKLRRDGLSVEAIEAALLEENERRCQPPLPDDEVREIARSMANYPPGPSHGRDGQGHTEGAGGDSISFSSIRVERERKEMPADRWQPRPLGEAPEGAAPIEWLWEGFIARGMSSELYGVWKSGKSTLLACLLRQMAQGGELAGRPVRQGRALIVSEEGAQKWAARSQELSIPLGAHDLIARPFARGRATWQEWTAFTTHLATLVREKGYDLVVLDSLANLWPVVEENQAGEVLRAVSPFMALLEAGAGLLLIHHPRKSDGDEATAGRGSGALPAWVDTIIEFRRYAPEDKATAAGSSPYIVVTRPSSSSPSSRTGPTLAWGTGPMSAAKTGRMSCWLCSPPSRLVSPSRRCGTSGRGSPGRGRAS